MNFKEGEVLFFDKPLTWTSFAVVNKIRYHLCRRLGVKKLKVGHAGTLDPLATGVMIVCTGKATKRIEEFQYHTKEYVATLMLGATTPSYDLEKEIDATYPIEHITRERVEETLKKFIGSLLFGNIALITFLVIIFKFLKILLPQLLFEFFRLRYFLASR